MGQPQNREWTRDFRYFNEDTGRWEADVERSEELLHAEFSACAAIMHREGGGFTLAPLRVEQPPAPGSLTGESEFVNLGVHVEHRFVPAQRAQPQAPQVPAPEPLPEPELEMHFPAGVEGDEPGAVMADPGEDEAAEPVPLDPSRLSVPVQ